MSRRGSSQEGLSDNLERGSQLRRVTKKGDSIAAGRTIDAARDEEVALRQQPLLEGAPGRIGGPRFDGQSAFGTPVTPAVIVERFVHTGRVPHHSPEGLRKQFAAVFQRVVGGAHGKRTWAAGEELYLAVNAREQISVQ